MVITVGRLCDLVLASMLVLADHIIMITGCSSGTGILADRTSVAIMSIGMIMTALAEIQPLLIQLILIKVATQLT